MLSTVDRVQVVVTDRSAAAAGYRKLLDAAEVRQDRLSLLAARRTVLQIGRSEVELLEPDGAGPVADFLARTKGGLYAPGFSTRDLNGLRAHLAARGVKSVQEGGQLFVQLDRLGMPGQHVVVSSAVTRRPVGLLQCLYEVTLLVPDFAATVRDTAKLFALEASHFVPIRSEEFGYEGTLTLFHPDRLDRFEIITPFDAAKTMGRYFARRGPSWYMCFAEAADLAAVRARLLEHAPSQWTGVPSGPVDSLFIHPPALGGMMMGVSRTTFAWTWSGSAQRVQPGGEA